MRRFGVGVGTLGNSTHLKIYPERKRPKEISRRVETGVLCSRNGSEVGDIAFKASFQIKRYCLCQLLLRFSSRRSLGGHINIQAKANEPLAFPK